MSDDAKKVMNLSLSKMAESRSIRRGGSSLHKHLLIASVLTKAQRAFFENWYLDTSDTDCPPNSPFPRPIPQQEDPGSAIDPRFLVEVESENEIDLPSDILTCVEKLGDFSPPQQFEEEMPNTLSYLDLDAPPNSIHYLKSSEVVIEPILLPGPSSAKRPRAWSIEDDHDQELNLPSELGEKLRKNGVSVTPSGGNNKRMRLEEPGPFRTKFEDEESSSDEEDSFLSEVGQPWEERKSNRDRRVPSSGSCSDDDAESMEVDQITSLVQYFSLKAKGKGMVRSLSSPDLCNRPEAPDPPSEFFGPHLLQHRVLTMTV